MGLKIDLHTHTIASGHAFNTVTEMAAEAANRGVRILGVTDHGPAQAGSAKASYFRNGYRLAKEIHGVRILFGIEANIISANGDLDLSDQDLENLDIRMAGLHTSADSPEENTRAVINAMKNPLLKVISHPYGITGEIDVDIEKIVKAAREYQILLEVNCSYFYKPKERFVRTQGEIKKMVALLKEHNEKVLVNSDAHSCREVGRDKELRDKFEYLGLRDEMIMNNYEDQLMRFLRIAKS